ncbi:migration and invasion enhancer 1-like [Mytilus galloprovincialis]|uniref:migration and invasion enhancer 1-like n=1 Tax=Mytilus galloprovincialis TaxID=29158 RepID=UPI003F7BBB83
MSTMGPESSYEITVDGHFVFSKLKLGGYPYNDDIMQCVRIVHTGGTPEVVKRAKKPTFLK